MIPYYYSIILYYIFRFLVTWLLFMTQKKAYPLFRLQSEDPEEDARLKQLQAAAAHWQQHQQHRVGFQYQGIMQKHTQLQQILQQYQQAIQHPPHIQVSFPGPGEPSRALKGFVSRGRFRCDRGRGSGVPPGVPTWLSHLSPVDFKREHATTVCKIGEHYGLSVEHRKLYSLSCSNLHWKRF